MKSVKIIREFNGWNEQCLYCEKIIEGYTPKQVKQLMSVHLLYCKEKKDYQKKHREEYDDYIKKVEEEKEND